jgi:ABC-type multidrug transport system fused ATPase/permease subunit
LICDEATSALDTATERDIMASLQELAVGRTSVFVAHRLSTIKGCDKIVVMSEGVAVEEGTHDQLMAAGRVYADMWTLQVSWVLLSRCNEFHS